MRRGAVWAALATVVGCEAPKVYIHSPPPAPEPKFAEYVGVTPTPLPALRVRLEAADKMNSPFERDAAVKKLVAEVASRGDATDPAALGTLIADCLKKMNSPFDRDEAAGGCVRELVRRGLSTEAVTVARTMNSPFNRDEALKLVVGGQP
jgi:hypothetical protein